MNLSFVIVGVGGVGMNIAISLVQIQKILDHQIKEIHLVDYDIIEKSNLNRLPMLNYIGKPKTHSLADFILTNIGYENINVFPYCGDGLKYLKSGFHINGTNNILIILDCTDRTIVQKQVLEIAKNRPGGYDTIYMRVGNENNIVNIEFNDNYASKLKVHQQGYVSTPTNPYYISGTLFLFYYELTKFLSECIHFDEIKYDKFYKSRKVTYDLDLFENLNFIKHYKKSTDEVSNG